MSSVAPSRSLQASALTFLILSIGHTVQGTQWTAEKSFKNIKGSKPWTCGTLGWYQGGAFLLMTSIIHYQWSNNPAALNDPLNKAIAGIVNAILWASSAWYAKMGVKDNCVAVGLSAALQAYSVFL
ncbi:hypothetical protein N7462_008685 [Penicillium macrosclerotiorum]|uniref:uncharacterized protein n=1 Tax=Penicillium macrosclerotiorum TaxID=303699 RepID=UPI0025493799|nr:uncharacterized protein N7462_008685 [Penicillium macrosclerotiorum]KAJ5675788.1 hypothetical protein N7462_008685 [Penicillium macrosclerotiorum]